MNEIRINSIEVAPEAKIVKALTLHGRGFSLLTTYALADGRTVQSHVTAARKKDILPRLERERQNAATGAMRASFDDEGRFFGTCTTYDGCGGFVPRPMETQTLATA